MGSGFHNNFLAVHGIMLGLYHRAHEAEMGAFARRCHALRALLPCDVRVPAALWQLPPAAAADFISQQLYSLNSLLNFKEFKFTGEGKGDENLLQPKVPRGVRVERRRVPQQYKWSVAKFPAAFRVIAKIKLCC